MLVATVSGAVARWNHDTQEVTQTPYRIPTPFPPGVELTEDGSRLLLVDDEGVEHDVDLCSGGVRVGGPGDVQRGAVQPAQGHVGERSR